KSTLLMHVAAQFAARGGTVLYCSGEESARQVRMRAERLDALAAGLLVLAENDLDAICSAIRELRPALAIVDSIQTVYDAGLDAVGTVVVATLEGTRPLLVELQTLVTGDSIQMPRRSANGFDLNRLHMLIAVLENRARIKLSTREVYVNVAAGMRVSEPAADLGLALSLAGNARNEALTSRTVVVGELGLVGEVRRVGQLER